MPISQSNAIWMSPGSSPSTSTKSPDQLGAEQIREYLLHLVRDKKSSANTFQVHRTALKFLYVKTLKQPWFDELVARTRKHRKLPTVLSAAEITHILNHTLQDASRPTVLDRNGWVAAH
jgi:site-specific recombinase XerD